MRVRFRLKNLEPFRFDVEGARYTFSELVPIAEKRRLTTNISEFVFKLPTGKHVYLTVVGDEDQVSGRGVERGWYVAEVLSEKDAAFLIEALAPFTNLYR